MLKSAAVLGRDLASVLCVSVAAGTSDTDDETSLRDEAASSMAYNIRMRICILMTYKSHLIAWGKGCGIGVRIRSFFN